MKDRHYTQVFQTQFCCICTKIVDVMDDPFMNEPTSTHTAYISIAPKWPKTKCFRGRETFKLLNSKRGGGGESIKQWVPLKAIPQLQQRRLAADNLPSGSNTQGLWRIACDLAQNINAGELEIQVTKRELRAEINCAANVCVFTLGGVCAFGPDVPLRTLAHVSGMNS